MVFLLKCQSNMLRNQGIYYIRLVDNSVAILFRVLGLFIDCHFLFEVQLLSLYYIGLLKFCHLKIVSGAVDARK